MTHSIISLGKGFTFDPCKELVSPVGSVGASKGRWPFEVAAGDPHLCTLAPGKLSRMDSSSGFSEGLFEPLILAKRQLDTLPITLPIWRVFGQSLRTCVQRKPTAAYARTQQNA